MKYVSYLPQAQDKINTFMFNVADAIAKNTERVIKVGFLDFPKPPIETGTLRRSITGKVLKVEKNKEVVAEVRASTILVTGLGLSGNTKKGGKEVEYAKFIEYGTVKMSPRPFMRNGAKKADKTNQAIIKKLASQQTI